MPTLTEKIMALKSALRPTQFRFERVENYAVERGHEGACIAATELACETEAINTELLAALQGLVKVNEDHNADMLKILGRPWEWNDSYLDAARAAIARATLPENNQPRKDGD